MGACRVSSSVQHCNNNSVAFDEVGFFVNDNNCLKSTLNPALLVDSVCWLLFPGPLCACVRAFV